MDSWTGIGRVVVALDRNGYRLMLSKIAAGEWRAQFSHDPMTSPSGSGVAPTPWAAVQRAAWVAIKKAPPGELR